MLLRWNYTDIFVINNKMETCQKITVIELLKYSWSLFIHSAQYEFKLTLYKFMKIRENFTININYIREI